MRKRLSCGVLALMLVISLIPAAVVPVNASSNLESSEEVIAFIKKVEGFNPKAFWDVSQWSIGYGTPASPGQTITEAAADKAMREELSRIDQKLNEFAASYGLEFSQNEHDALASFSFNCGTGWMKNDGRFRRALIQSADLNTFLFGMCLWANNNSIPDPSLIKRRLCEANIFFNGIYSKSMPEDYSFVIFDPNGGIPGSGGEDKMQGYSLKEPAPILAADPFKSGRTFLGWFTEATGGKQVTQLSASTAKMTLYAHYDGTGPEDTEQSVPKIIAKGTVSCDTYVNIRKGPSTVYELVGKAADGTRVELYEIKTVGSVRWGKIASGWLSLDYVELDEDEEESEEEKSPETEKPIDSGTVISETKLNVRSGPGVGYSRVASLAPGTRVTIYEFHSVSTSLVQWARIGSDRWVCMDYVELDSDEEEEETPEQEETDEPLYTGWVSSTTNLNVRSGPGVSYSRIRSLAPGTKVTVYEEKQTNGSSWGRIDAGSWVCLDYISDESEEEESEDSTGNGKVISSTGLNVRAGAGTGYPIVSQLRAGARVSILERKTSGGLSWGRIEEGWVCMTYIRMDE